MFIRFASLFPKGLFRLLIRSLAPFGILVSLIVGAQATFACLTPGSLIGGFDNDTYVFLGKVKGYTKASVLEGTSSEVFGLIVEASDRVFPTNGPNRYVLFPTRRMADCSRGGFGIGELSSSYPLDSEIRVIAQHAEGVRTHGAAHTILEAGFKNHTSVSLNSLERRKGRSLLSTEFNYSLADDTFLSSRAERFFFVAFEIQKDLVRLERAKTDAERQSVLNRLKKAPDYAQIDFAFIEVTYTMSKPSNP